MSKVWSKNTENSLSKVIESYEVGLDYLLDRKLIKYEIASTAAHIRMLEKIGILSVEEKETSLQALKRIYTENGDNIEIRIEDEDIHSKIESLLVDMIGETGKKIHTGRSRNDQVLTVTRLFEKDSLYQTADELHKFLIQICHFADKEFKTVLPGYTHTKQAMPTTVGAWTLSIAESGLDHLAQIRFLIEMIDKNPLGSGSGFGVPLPLDREMTAELMGFKKVFENPIAVQNSRGKYEAMILDSLGYIMLDFSRIASDLLFYNMDELLFFEASPAITTGSSIMPQKKNLDVLELLRARSHLMFSYSTQIKTLCAGLHSGYNRDLQETKEPLFKGFELIQSSIRAMKAVFQNIRFDEEKTVSKMGKGILATDLAFDKVKQGIPFRNAYRKAAEEIESIEMNQDTISQSIQNRNSPGSPFLLSTAKYKQMIGESGGHLTSEHNDFIRQLDELL